MSRRLSLVSILLVAGILTSGLALFWPTSATCSWCPTGQMCTQYTKCGGLGSGGCFCVIDQMSGLGHCVAVR